MNEMCVAKHTKTFPVCIYLHRLHHVLRSMLMDTFIAQMLQSLDKYALLPQML